jgi:hypothetical protein
VSCDSSWFGFAIDFDNGTIIFDGGFTTEFEMLDRDGEFCGRDRVRFLMLQMPPDGLFISIDINDLQLQHVDDPLH